MEQSKYDVEREIDLKQLILFLWENIMKIVLAGVLVAVLLAGIKSVAIIPSVEGNGKYIGTSKIFVANEVPKAASTAIRTYITSDDSLNNVIKTLNLDITTSELNSMIDLEDSTDTLLVINVTGTDNTQVQNITDSLTNQGIEKIQSSFKYKSATIASSAYTSAVKGIGWSGLINKIIKYCVVGFILGSGGVAFLYAFFYVHDSSIKDEKDVSKYLNVPVLGNIPAIEGTRKKINKDKKNKKQRLSQYKNKRSKRQR